MEELLGAEEVAAYLGVQPTTVYRWCRDGQLPCLKLGKAWRIRRSALDHFLRRSERRQTLTEHLSAFFTVPDHVVVVAEDEILFSRLDAAFLQIGEASGGLLIKFTGGEERPISELRARLVDNGLEVERLEAEGRFLWGYEADPTDRVTLLRQALAEEGVADRSVWVSLNWTRRVDLATALGQQEELATLVEESRLVVKTTVLEAAVAEWSPAEQRSHRGQIRISHDQLLLMRAVPLPET